MPSINSALFLTASIALFGCSKEREAEAPLAPASRTQGVEADAADEIARARCDRSQRCNRIGPGGEYSDRDHCLSVARPEALRDLGSCPRGVDQEDLQECVVEIANQDCDAIFGQMEEIVSCSMDDLCRD